MTERREVRVADSFFAANQLGSQRGPNGQPSVTDFIVIDLPVVAERFAASFDELPEAIAGVPSIRMCIGSADISRVPGRALRNIIERPRHRKVGKAVEWGTVRSPYITTDLGGAAFLGLSPVFKLSRVVTDTADMEASPTSTDVTIMVSVDHALRDCQPEFKQFRNHPAPLGEIGRPKRFFDIFDEQGTPVISGGYRGPDHEGLAAELMDWALSHRGGVRIEFHDGPERRFDCCGVTFTEGTLPSGKTVQYWMEHHGQRTNGPDGWHYRVIGTDGNIELNQIAPDTKRY